MDLIWVNPNDLDWRDVAGAVAVLEAAREVDTPYELSHMVSALVAHITYGWDSNPPIMAATRDRDGRVIGVLEVELPIWDNRHIGEVRVTVDPQWRRRGVGRSLFEAGVERAQADGRTVILTSGVERPASIAFAKAIGLQQAAVEVRRRLELLALDWDRLDNEYAKAAHRAAAYDLVRLPGTTPAEMLPDLAAMTAAINDAPTDDLDIEDEVFSPERIRAFETAQVNSNRRIYRLVARERDTGALAGHTVVGVESDRPWFGWQYDTSVLRSHRGHRLGLFLKIGMLHWLREQEFQLRAVDTWNAASNVHMIEVNEVLGYRVVANEIVWQRHL